MAEVKTYVATARVDFACEETVDCEGMMIYMGMVIPGETVKYKHKCPICAETADLDKKYPETVYEDQ